MYEVISDMKKDFEKEMAKMQASIDELKKSIRRREKRVCLYNLITCIISFHSEVKGEVGVFIIN